VSQLKVSDRVLLPEPILAEEMFNRGNIPHQNRHELLAPPFLSREKVERKFALIFYYFFIKEKQ